MAKSRSPEERSAIDAAAGMMCAVWLTLRTEVKQKGGKDGDIYRLNTPEGQSLIEQFAALIAGAANPIMQIAWKLVFNWVVAVCRFTSYVDPSITAENFPFVVGALDIKEVVALAISRDMSTVDVLVFLDEQGYRAATLFELLFWWLTHPAEQADCFVVALGQLFQGNAPCVNGHGDYRGLGLNTVGRGWGQLCQFAAVRKSAAPAA